MTLAEAEELFELSAGYTLRDVKTARNHLAQLYHPDMNDDSRTSEVMMRRINEAYGLLIKVIKTGAKSNQPGETAERERTTRTSQEGAARQEHMRREAEKERRQRERARREREQHEAEQRAREREKLELEYQKACEEADKAETVEEHLKVSSLFKTLGGYRDSSQRSSYHENAARDKRETEIKEALARATKASRLSVVSTAPTVAASLTLNWFAYSRGGIVFVFLYWLLCGGYLPLLYGLVTLLNAVSTKSLSAKWQKELEVGNQIEVGNDYAGGLSNILTAALTATIGLLFLFPGAYHNIGLTILSLFIGGISCLVRCDVSILLAIKILLAGVSSAILLTAISPFFTA